MKKSIIERVTITSLRRRYVFAAVVAIMVLIAGFWWFGMDRVSREHVEIATVKNAISKHMVLPSNEEPTLAVVADKSKLTNKYLAAKAENGDQILIYTQQQLAIIYRPSIDRIAGITVVTADSALAESQRATVTVLNGTADDKKAASVIEKLKATYPDMKVESGGVANKRDFSQTIVIDNTGEKDYLVDGLAQLLGGTRGVLPLSESKVTTDLMIIIGTTP